MFIYYRNNLLKVSWKGWVKRRNCIAGIPAGDCDSNSLGNEGSAQDFLRPGGRHPGRKRTYLREHEYPEHEFT